MRVGLIIVGIVLLGLGLWVALGDLHYNHTDTHTQAVFGPVKVETSSTSQKTVPAPVGYTGIFVGGILILIGALKKK